MSDDSMDRLHLFRSYTRPAAAVVLCAFGASGCATHLLRYDEPARQEDVALSARAEEPDLVLLHVISGVLPKDRHYAIVEIAVRGDAMPRLVVQKDEIDAREQSFVKHEPAAWKRERREAENLLVPGDFAPSERRDYRVRCVRAASGGFELVVVRTEPAPLVELGRLPFPQDLTPPDTSVAGRIALGIPLAAIDLAWIPVVAASLVLLLPFGSWQLVEELADDELR